MTAHEAQRSWGSDFVPEWTLGDRLRKARTHAGLEQAALANDIGISRNTVRNYESELVKPRRPVLLAWAMRTGVSLDWLIGDQPNKPGGDAGWAPWGSNPQPADYKVATSPPPVTRGDDAVVIPFPAGCVRPLPLAPSRTAAAS